MSADSCPDQKRVVPTKLTAIPLETPISFKALLFLASHFTFVSSKERQYRCYLNVTGGYFVPTGK